MKHKGVIFVEPMEIHAVKGMQDLFGDSMVQWRGVEERVRKILEGFGYHEIRTPVLEKIEVFSQTVGEDTDIVEKQMFTVQTSETLVLRPEETAAFIRAVVEHRLHQTGHPQRFYYYLPMFRHERPQKGRLRQFHQFGAELINDPSHEADAELITTLDHVCKSFEVNFQAKVNSVGCGSCRPIYKEALKKYFQPHLSKLCLQCQKRFERSPLRILDCKSETCKAIAKNAPLISEYLDAECKDHHTAMKMNLVAAKVSFIDDPTIVRGLDYYTRTAFEFVSNDLGAQDAIGGGGRYDGLSTRFGEKPFPAVGYAFGMERLMLLLAEKMKATAEAPTFYFAALGEKPFSFLFEKSLEYRRRGIRIDMSYEKSKGLKWLLKQADRVGSPYAVILGDDEIQKGIFLLKSMKEGKQEEIPLKDFESTITSRGTNAT